MKLNSIYSILFLMKISAGMQYEMHHNESDYASDSSEEHVTAHLEGDGEIDNKKANRTALIRALENKSHTVVQDIAKKDCQLANSVLIKAITLKNYQFVDTFLEAGIDLNVTVQGWHPLVSAVYNNDFVIVEKLLKKNIRTDVFSPDGITALTWAVRFGNASLAHLILSQGADANLRNANSTTPLMNAAMRCNVGLVTLLLNYKADPLIKDLSGRTAFDYIASQVCKSAYKEEISRILLAAQNQSLLEQINKRIIS